MAELKIKHFPDSDDDALCEAVEITRALKSIGFELKNSKMVKVGKKTVDIEMEFERKGGE